MSSLTVLMPVYNERETAEKAIRRVLEADMGVDRREILIVDDGSTGGTAEILRDGSWGEEVRVVTHDVNRGKGGALQTGLQHAEGEITTVMDADLEYDAGEVGGLVAPIAAGEAEAVFGVRGFQAHNAFSFWY